MLVAYRKKMTWIAHGRSFLAHEENILPMLSRKYLSSYKHERHISVVITAVLFQVMPSVMTLNMLIRKSNLLQNWIC